MRVFVFLVEKYVPGCMAFFRRVLRQEVDGSVRLRWQVSPMSEVKGPRWYPSGDHVHEKNTPVGSVQSSTMLQV